MQNIDKELQGDLSTVRINTCQLTKVGLHQLELSPKNILGIKLTLTYLYLSWLILLINLLAEMVLSTQDERASQNHRR